MDNPHLERRYLISFESRRLPHIFTDVLIIGAGIAGLRAAIEAAEYGQVILLTKGELPDSKYYYAQGRQAAAVAMQPLRLPRAIRWQSFVSLPSA